MRAAAAFIAAAAVSTAMSCSTNPVTGKTQLDLLGESQELALGAQLYPAYIQDSLGPIEDEALQAMVTRAGEEVARVSHRPALPYGFVAVNEPAVNAFALPGGKICITRGLLARLESEDGLAAVLAHEVGHVTARHVVGAYNRQALATALILGGAAVMEAKDVQGRELITLGAVVGAQLALAHYSREQERQSDRLGLEYSVAAGYSPYGLVETHRVLLELQRTQPGLLARLFASHPMSSARLATAETDIEQLPGDVRGREKRVEPYLRTSERLRALRPAWDLAHEGRVLVAQGKKREGTELLGRSAQQAPEEGVIRTLHAVALNQVERTREARVEAMEGARRSPKVFLTRLVGGSLLVSEDARASLDHLDEAERILPGVAQVSYMRGRANETLGHRDAAVAAYREALSRDPQGEVGKAAAARLHALGAA